MVLRQNLWVMFRGWRQPFRASNPKMLSVEIPAQFRVQRPRIMVARTEELVGGEYLDFTNAIRNGMQLYAPAEVGHRTATVSHIGNIAMQLKRRLSWQPGQEQFSQDQEANSMLSREQRHLWTLGNIDSWIKISNS